jgi:N-acetyltransferase 10
MRKKLDSRIKTLIETCVANSHRSLLLVVGEKARDQVSVARAIDETDSAGGDLASHSVEGDCRRTTVCVVVLQERVRLQVRLFGPFLTPMVCSSHRRKRMRQLQQRIKTGKLNVNEDDPFDLFVASTEIRYTYYHETHTILGNTFGMCVLQDFEALTPNLLARTIETVKGAGLVVILLQSLQSLKQLYTIAMVGELLSAPKLLGAGRS